MTAGEVSITITVLAVGLILLAGVISVVRDDHRRARVVRRTGVPGSATIMKIESESYDGEDRYALRLSISGPGITAFEITFRCAADRQMAIGDRLGVLVNPHTNDYVVPGRR